MLTSFQIACLVVLLLVSVVSALCGLYESHHKKNAFGTVFLLGPLGIFVWGDAVVFGIFWAGVATACLILQDWILFWLIFFLFFTVRSLGETIYWLNQQFSSIVRVKPENYWPHQYFHNDSTWFIYQTINQCVTVIALVMSLYFAKLWLVG